ncbi:hypothetical protein GLU64_00755 [Nanohaloarchaea archaeon]|nr:hypothetical protein [Candidatus Nanohaloarchaea archaeon]
MLEYDETLNDSVEASDRFEDLAALKWRLDAFIAERYARTGIDPICQ